MIKIHERDFYSQQLSKRLSSFLFVLGSNWRLFLEHFARKLHGLEREKLSKRQVRIYTNKD